MLGGESHLVQEIAFFNQCLLDCIAGTLDDGIDDVHTGNNLDSSTILLLQHVEVGGFVAWFLEDAVGIGRGLRWE